MRPLPLQVGLSLLHPLLALSAPSYSTSEPSKSLQGRFLHITDLHPDPFYKPFSSIDKSCHRGSGSAGAVGAPKSDCDSPYSLLDAIFSWLNTSLPAVDFVVWTGDSARHDNDEKIPRTFAQIEESNKEISKRMKSVFGKTPIVPTLGNNDVMPHNLFLPGPNRWSRYFGDLWGGKFGWVPEHQKHVFREGGYFWVEVVKGRLAAMSLNTLYFFESNSAVDGCESKHEPGYLQFEWMRVQLTHMREHGMKVILTGHVPPARVDSKTSWDETCWQKFTLWKHAFRDVIVGDMYGHMNIDHFMIQDWEDVGEDVKRGEMRGVEGEPMGVMSPKAYLVDLRHLFRKIPDIVVELTKKKGKKDEDLGEIGGPYAERYSVSFVNPSVIPNYFPTFRIFEYNITGLEEETVFEAPVLDEAPTEEKETHHLDLRSVPDWNNLGPDGENEQVLRKRKTKVPDLDNAVPAQATSWNDNHAALPKPLRGHRQVKIDETEEESEQESEKLLEDQASKKRHKNRKTRKSHKKHKFILPEPPSPTATPGPAYSPQPFTLVSYKQYFANLTYINNMAEHSSSRGGEPKHPKPREFEFEVEYDTATDEVYRLKDLTVRSMLDLAARIAGSEGRPKSPDAEPEKKNKKNKKKKKNKKEKDDKTWLTFVRRAFVQTLEDDQLEERFG